MKVLYRISDSSHKSNKPDFVNDKKKMFIHFMHIFRDHDIYIFPDNVCQDTYDFIEKHKGRHTVHRIALGNADSFLFTAQYALEHFNDNDVIYFAEDDYIYLKHAPNILLEGIQLAPYVSCYDNPDKYINACDGGPNPFIEGGGELTRLMKTANTHWKYTNSCCMTFATTVKTLKEDYDVMQFHCRQEIPNDFLMFIDLGRKGKTLVSCVPGVATHGQYGLFSPFVNWLEVDLFP